MYVRWSLCLHHSTLPHHPHPFTVLQLPQAATTHRFTNAPWSALVSRFMLRQAHHERPMVFVSASLHFTSPSFDALQLPQAAPSSPLYRATTATSSNAPQIHKCPLISFGKQIHASPSAPCTSDGLCVCITPLYLTILNPLQLPQAATPDRFTNAPWSALVSRFTPRQSYSARPTVFVAASLHLMPGPSMPPYNFHKQQSLQIHKACTLVSFGKQIHASPVVQCTCDGLCCCITPPHAGPVYAALQLPQAAKFADSQIMPLGHLAHRPTICRANGPWSASAVNNDQSKRGAHLLPK